MLVNRFLLWGLFSMATFVNLAADPAARVIYAALGGSATQRDMDIVARVVIGTMGVTMVLGVRSTRRRRAPEPARGLLSRGTGSG